MCLDSYCLKKQLHNGLGLVLEITQENAICESDSVQILTIPLPLDKLIENPTSFLIPWERTVQLNKMLKKTRVSEYQLKSFIWNNHTTIHICFIQVPVTSCGVLCLHFSNADRTPLCAIYLVLSTEWLTQNIRGKMSASQCHACYLLCASS